MNRAPIIQAMLDDREIVTILERAAGGHVLVGNDESIWWVEASRLAAIA